MLKKINTQDVWVGDVLPGRRPLCTARHGGLRRKLPSEEAAALEDVLVCLGDRRHERFLLCSREPLLRRLHSQKPDMIQICSVCRSGEELPARRPLCTARRGGLRRKLPSLVGKPLAADTHANGAAPNGAARKV